VSDELSSPRSWVTAWTADLEVVVARPGDAGLHQAELVLASCDPDHTVVTMVGASRWSGGSFAAAGPHLCALRERDAIVFAPLLAAKALPGIGPEPLPRSINATARALIAHTPAHLPERSHQRSVALMSAALAHPHDQDPHRSAESVEFAQSTLSAQAGQPGMDPHPSRRSLSAAP